MGGTLRVLQTGNLRLDEPLTLEGAAQSLHDVALNARFAAFTRLIDAALEANIHLLLLTGPLFDWQADRRPAWFLAEQFRRLQSIDAKVLWVDAESRHFAEIVTVPENVVQLPLNQPGFLRCHGWDLAVHWKSAAGTSHRNGHTRDLTLTMHLDEHPQHGHIQEVEYTNRLGRGIHAEILSSQGGSATDTGPHGGRLVTCHDAASLEQRFIATDIIRWEQEVLELDERSSLEDVQRKIVLRQQQLRHDHNSAIICCRWILTGHGPVMEHALRHPELESFIQQNVIQGHPDFLASLELQPNEIVLAKWHADEITELGVSNLCEFRHSQATPLLAFSRPQWAQQLQTEARQQAVLPRLVRSLAEPLARAA